MLLVSGSYNVQDTLHFVTYDNAVRVVFTDGDLSETGKEDLKSQIHAATSLLSKDKRAFFDG